MNLTFQESLDLVSKINECQFNNIDVKVAPAFTYLQKLSDSLENSRNKIIIKLPVNSSIVANNYFWLHGRRPFKIHPYLSRELLRIRGCFFEK